MYQGLGLVSKQRLGNYSQDVHSLVGKISIIPTNSSKGKDLPYCTSVSDWVL